MKKITLLTLTTLLASSFALVGCTPKTAGMDTAYLNKNRGAAGAQISRDEAAQYSRQQRLSADEVRLENMKRRQTTDSVTEKANAANSAASAVRNINWMLKGF